MVHKSAQCNGLQCVLELLTIRCALAVSIYVVHVSQLQPGLFLSISFQNRAYAEKARCDVENRLD
jgi:hypothetical protein